MSKSNKPAAKPTYGQLENRIDAAYDFLGDMARSPDADDWLRYHIMVIQKIMHGENLKGTFLFDHKTGTLKPINEDHYYTD